MYAAIYLPVLPPNMTQSPSRKGFLNKDSAWEYVFSNLCSMCKKSRQRALDGEVWENNISEWYKNEENDGCEPPTLYPACTYEWEVIDENELENLENIINI